MAKRTKPIQSGNAISGVNPFIRKRSIAHRDCNEEFTRPCRSIGKMLHSFSVDGVSTAGNSLLSRQYDDAKGAVDPASDIHTDPHLLRDSLMRKHMSSGTPKPTDNNETTPSAEA